MITRISVWASSSGEQEPVGGKRETCYVGDHVVRFEAVKVQRHEIEHAFALASPNPFLRRALVYQYSSCGNAMGIGKW
jgi:hypothetical protein